MAGRHAGAGALAVVRDPRRIFLRRRSSKMTMSEVRHFVHQPAGPLRRYVREILWVRSEHPRVQVLLPETTLTLALRQSGSALLDNETLPSAIVSGLQQRARMVEHTAGPTVVIVRFTGVGAPAILHDRVDLLYNQAVPLDAVLPRQEIDHIQNILADTREIRQQVLAVERLLIRRIRAQNESSSQCLSPQIDASAMMSRQSEGRSSLVRVRLSTWCGFSQRTVASLFSFALIV